MATDSTNLPQGETTLDAGMDMTASDLDLTTVQEVANEPKNFVDLPKGNTVILLPVQPGQTVQLPTDSTSGVLAKIGPEGNLALVVDGRTIILQGFLKANDQSPVKIVTNDGDDVNVADLIAATDPSLDIQTAAGPASGDQGDTDGSGIYIPFLAGPGLGGILAEGILDPTALQYRLIDDEYREFVLDEEGKVTFDITFDILGGIVNEDDLRGDEPEVPQVASLVLGGKGSGHGYNNGMNGEGNDPFDDDTTVDGPHNDQAGSDDTDGVPDSDREPLSTVATIKANFPGSGAGTLTLDLDNLPTDLKSHGELVSFVLIPGLGAGDKIIGFIDDGNGTYELGERVVLTVEADTNLSPTGEFNVTFTLWDQIDHAAPDADKNNEPDLLGANEQVFDLPVHFNLSGGGASADGSLPLGVQDDIPFFGKVIECGGDIDIVCIDSEIIHDETAGIQPHSDDTSIYNPYVFFLGLKLAGDLHDAGYEFPHDEGKLLGVAKTKVNVSFGADGPAVYVCDSADPDVRNSIFGELEDRTNADGDGVDDGENEHPFELFMVKNGTAPGNVTEGDLTIDEQKTNCTVTYGEGDKIQVLDVYVDQVDAHTIVGYVNVPNCDEGFDKVAVFTVHIDDNGCLTFYQTHQLNHDVDGKYFPQHDDALEILGADGQPLVYVRATDYDGDHAIQPVNLTVEDDGPRCCGIDWGRDYDSQNGVGVIDEEALRHGIWGGPGDDKGGTHTDGKILFDFGADKPGHLAIQELTVKDCTGKTVLQICVDENGCLKVDENCLKAIDERPIEIKADGPDCDGKVTWTAYIKDCPGEKVFSFTLDTSGDCIGEFDFCLYKPLEHPDTNGNPYDNNWDNGKGSFEDNFKFDFKVRGYDSDGDYADCNVKLNVDDDSPDACKVEISFCDEDNKLVHDETGGVQIGGKWFPWDHDPDASRQPEDDTWYVKDFGKFEQEEHCLDPIGYAKTELKVDLSGGSYDPKAAFGADGPGHVSAVSIVTDCGKDFCGEKTNLTDTKTGCAIFLFTEEVCGETYVVGRVGGKDGEVSFALTISDCGDLELAQYRAIQHPDGCDSDESLKLLDCEGNALIHLQVKVTDADGDAVYARQPIDGCDGNPSIVFQDDGPCVENCPGGKVVLAMDETDKFQLFPSDYDQPNVNNGPLDGNTDEGDWLSNIASVLQALFPFPIPDVLGAAKDNVSDLFKVKFGTDGGCVVCYDLTILNDGKTNLVDTESGTCITLCKGPNGIVEGRDGEGNLVFAICLDKDSGEIVSVQFRAIDHGDEETNQSNGLGGAHDEVTSLLNGILGVTATAFDKDGDKDSETVDIGCGVIFEDDGPKFKDVDWGRGDSKHGTGLIDEDALPKGKEGGPGDDDGGKSADGKVIFDFGSDKPGKVEINALEVKDDRGNLLLKITLDSNGNPVASPNNLFAIDNKTLAFEKSAPDANGVVTWTAFIAGHPDQKVFTFSLDTCDDNIGEFDFCLLQPLEHPFQDDGKSNNGQEKSFEDNLKFDFTVRGYDGDGDSADGHVKLSVDDDSPCVDACEGAKLNLAMDETDKFQLNPSDYDQPGVPEGKLDGPTPEGDWISNIASIIDALLPGDFPNPLGVATDNVKGLFKVDLGADCGNVCYELTILCEKTNLVDTETGTCITLTTNQHGVVEGRDGCGNLVFAVWVDKDSGDIISAQFRAIDHGGEEGKPGAHDEVKFLADGILGVTATATDNDGDTVCKTVDIGCGLSFEDDGPKADLDEKRNAKIVLDESAGKPGEYPDPNANDENNSADPDDIAYAKVPGNQLFNDNSKLGSDGFGSRVYSLCIASEGVASGLLDSATNTVIKLFQVDENTVEGRVGDSSDVAFRIHTDPATGEVTVSQYIAVEHDNPGDSSSTHDEASSPEVMDAGVLNLKVTVTDGDCDADSDTIDLGKMIQFQDDGPTFCGVQWGDDYDSKDGVGLIDEDALPKGNAGGPGDDEGGKHADGKVVFDIGSDQPGKLEINGLTVKDCTGKTVLEICLDQNGNLDIKENCLFAIDNKAICVEKSGPDADGVVTWTAFIAGCPDEKVFTFSLDTCGDCIGEFDFCLLNPLEHPLTNDPQTQAYEKAFEDNFKFDFKIRGYDSDGDYTDGHVELSVDDDSPTVTDCGCETNLLVNGSFEDLGKEDGGTLENGNWGVFSQIPGWKSGADEGNPSGLPGLEIQNNIVLVAKDGNYYVELDSDNLDQSDPAPSTTNASIYQDVTTVDGNNYVLSFSYSPREGNPASDGIEVWFDGQLVATINSGTVGQWTDYTFVVQAGEGDATPDLSKLEFKATGTANELGGLIDDVKLTACAVVDEDALPKGIEGGPGDDVGGACFSGSLGISFGADGGKSIEFCAEGQPCVTSGGCEVKYEWCGNPDGTGTLIAYTGDDPKAECNWVFTVAVQSLENGGEYKFTLLQAIDHPDTNNNPADDNYDDGKSAFEDNLILDLKFKATDNDCDSVEGTLKVNVDDDSPTVESCDSARVSLAMDETASFFPPFVDDDRPEADGPQDGPADEVDLGQFLANVFGAIFPGVIPDVLGAAKDNVADLFKVSFGADCGAVCYDLCILNDGKTNLVDTATGECITLVKDGSGIVKGVAGGEVVFAIWLDSDSGEIISAQFRAIDHGAEEGSPGAHDEVKSLLAGILGVKATATDNDGDAVSKTVDIGGGITFEDDGPDARNDTDNIQSTDGGQTFFAAGNVIIPLSTTNSGGDDVGSDQPGKIVQLSGVGGTDSDPTGDFVVQGLYGTLTVKANGDYNYDLDETNIGKIPSKATEQFTYTLSDKDGDTDTATLTIKFPEVKIPEAKIGVGPALNGSYKEDVQNAIHFSVNPQGDDTVVHVKIAGLVGWTVGSLDVAGVPNAANVTFDSVTGVLEFDVTGAGAGNTITGSFAATPPEDTDQDFPMTIEGTVQDGPVQAKDTGNTTVVVDAILDEYVNVEGADKSGVENEVAAQSINLGLAAAFQSTGFAGALAGGSDTDSSESHAVKLVFSAALPAGTVVEFNVAFGSVTQDLIGDPTGKTFIVTPNSLANLDDLVASIGLNLPAGFDGTINGQIQSASEEANTPPPVVVGNTELDITDNTKSDSADFSVTITAKPDVRISVGLANEGHCIFEDTPANFVVNAATDTASHLTSVVLTGLPVGWAYNFTGLDTDGAGGDVVVDLTQLALGQVTVTFPNGNVENYNGTFVATPPADSDVDFGTLTGQVNAVNDVNPLATNSTTDSDYFETDAVADGKDNANGGDGDGDALSVSIVVDDNGADGDSTFAANEVGTVKIGATFDDFKDGSEVHTVTIDAPAGFKFLSVDPASLPAGVTVQSLADGQVVLLVDSTDGVVPAGVGSFSDVVINVQNVSAPSGTTVTFTATAKAVETSLSGEECTTGNNEQSVSATDDATTFTNQIPIAYDDKKCGDEAAPQNANIMLIFDVSGSMNSPAGFDGLTKLQAAKQAAINMLTEYADHGGDVRVMLVWFNSSAQRQETWLDVDDAIAAINAIPASADSASTDYQDAIATAILGFQDTDGRGDPATHSGFVYFLSDGQPNNGGNPNDDGDGLPNNGITPATLTDWNNLLENNANNVEHVYSVGFGAGIPDGVNNVHLISVANPDNDAAPGDPNGTVLFVDNIADLSATLTGTVGTLNEGNVLDGSIENDPDAPAPNTPDFQGDGPAHVSYFEYNHPSLNDLDIQVTWDGAGALVVDGTANGANLLVNGTKVSFDTEHGRMTFDFSNGDYDFIAGSIDGGDKQEHFTYKITDDNGDQSNPADLTVCIKDVYVDKTPITYDDVVSGTEPAPKNANLLLVFDNSGSMNDPAGFGGLTKLQAAKQAAINLLNSYAATGGDVRVMLVTFNSDAGRQATWLDISAAITAINAIPQSNGTTDYQDAIASAISGFQDPDGRGDTTTHDGFVYFLSDGQPTTGGNGGGGTPAFGVTPGTLTTWNTLLENDANNIDHVYSVGFGSGIPNGASNVHLISVANPDNDAAPGDPNGTVLFVDNLADLSATLEATVGTEITGNILDGSIENDPDAPGDNTADDQGDGPAHLSYFEYDSATNDLDIKISWDGAGAVVVDGVANGKSTVINGKEVSFDTDHGRMTIDFSDGDFKLVAGTVSGGDKTEVFDYKITDVDGDVSNTSQLKVTIENLPPVVSINDTELNEGTSGNLTLKLSEAAPTAADFTVTFGKVGDTAASGVDYTVGSVTVHVNAGDTTASIPVDALPDGFIEGDEKYSVTISGGPGWVILDDTGVVTIHDVVVRPTTNAGSGSGLEDAADISVSLSGADANGTVVSFRITSLPGNGTLYLDGAHTTALAVGSIVPAVGNAATVHFVPAPNFNGSPTFQFAAIDNHGLEDLTPALATITVTAVDDAANAADDILIMRDVNDNDNYTVQSAWFLRNDTDADGPLSITEVNRSGLDSPNDIATNPGSSFTIDPDGNDNFTYKAGNGGTPDQATVDIQEDESGDLSGDGDSEIIVGTGGDNTLNGNGGNDILFGGGEDENGDTLNGGAGDDWLIYDNEDTFDGGADFDTLRFEAASKVNVDDDNGSNNFVNRINNIEAIDLRNGGNDDFGDDGENGDDALSAADVINMTEAGTLYIMGDNGDEVRLDGNWTPGGTAQVIDATRPDINGLTFTQYTLSGATVYVQSNVEVDNNL